jgi:hypothetical protein
LARHIYYSDDFAATWRTIFTVAAYGADDGANVSHLHGVWFDPDDATVIYFVVNGTVQGVWRLDLVGEAWTFDPVTGAIDGGTMDVNGVITINGDMGGCDCMFFDQGKVYITWGPKLRVDLTTNVRERIITLPTRAIEDFTTGLYDYQGNNNEVPYTLYMQRIDDGLLMGAYDFIDAAPTYYPGNNNNGLYASADDGRTWVCLWRNHTGGTSVNASGARNVVGPINGLMFMDCCGAVTLRSMWSFPTPTLASVDALRLERAATNLLADDTSTFSSTNAGWTSLSSVALGGHTYLPVKNTTQGLHGGECLEIGFGAPPEDPEVDQHWAQFLSAADIPFAAAVGNVVLSLYVRGVSVPATMGFDVNVVGMTNCDFKVSPNAYRLFDGWQRMIFPGIVTDTSPSMQIQIRIYENPALVYGDVTAEEMAAIRIYIDAIQIIATGDDWPTGISYSEYNFPRSDEYAVVPLEGAKSFRFNWRPGCGYEEIATTIPIATFYGSHGTTIALSCEASTGDILYSVNGGTATHSTAITFHHHDEIGFCLTLDGNGSTNSLSISDPVNGIQHVDDLTGLAGPSVTVNLGQDYGVTAYSIGHFYGMKTFDTLLTEAERETELALPASSTLLTPSAEAEYLFKPGVTRGIADAIIQPPANDPVKLVVDADGNAQAVDSSGNAIADKTTLDTAASDALAAKNASVAVQAKLPTGGALMHAAGAAVAESPATIAAGKIAENAIDAACIKADAVTKIAAGVVAQQNGPGGSKVPLTITVEGVPVEGVECWITTNIDGSNTIAGPLVTDVLGQTEDFMLEEDSGPFYLWRQKGGVNLPNPITLVWDTDTSAYIKSP